MDIKEQFQHLIKDILKLELQLIGISSPESLVHNSMTPEEIQEVEDELSVTLPLEYKEFLQIYGSLIIGPDIVYGKDRGKTPPFEEGEFSVLKNTLKLRAKYPKRFPENFVPILEEPDCGAVCLICGGENHGKLVLWGYHADYNSPELDCASEGPDFWTWLRDELISLKKDYEEELAKPMDKRGIRTLNF